MRRHPKSLVVALLLAAGTLSLLSPAAGAETTAAIQGRTTGTTSSLSVPACVDSLGDLPDLSAYGQYWIEFEQHFHRALMDPQPENVLPFPDGLVLPIEVWKCAYFCKDIYLVSVRGSGQDYATDLSTSPETSRVYAGLDSGTQKELGLHQLLYPAQSVDLIKSGLLPAALGDTTGEYLLNTYRQSVLDGVTSLSQFVAETGASCPDTRFVVAGYSQGALVVHEYLSHGAYSNADRIAAAVLISDPMKLPAVNAQNQILLGTAPAQGSGVCRAIDGAASDLSCLGYPSRDVSDIFRGRTWAVCDKGDAVCDTSTVLRARNPKTLQRAITRGMEIHTTAYKVDRESYIIGREIGVRIDDGRL